MSLHGRTASFTMLSWHTPSCSHNAVMAHCISHAQCLHVAPSISCCTVHVSNNTVVSHRIVSELYMHMHAVPCANAIDQLGLRLLTHIVKGIPHSVVLVSRTWASRLLLNPSLPVGLPKPSHQIFPHLPLQPPGLQVLLHGHASVLECCRRMF